MKRAHILRTSFVIAAVSAALSANAWIISAAGPFGGPADYTFSNLAGINAGTFGYDVTFDATGADLEVFDGASTLDLTGTGTASSAAGTISYSGTWVKNAATNLGVSTTGTYSATFDDNTDRFEWNIAGAVPEPAPFAVLGVGAIGLLLRRRRKA